MNNPRIQMVIDKLLDSPNACDQRKAVDLGELVSLSEGAWRGRFKLARFEPGPDRSLLVICELWTPGLLWSAGRAAEHEEFRFAMLLPHRYPMDMPGVRFMPPVPYTPHVVLGAHMPELTGLPPALQEYIRAGEGHCCFMMSSQWEPRRSTLALVVFQVSRIVSFTKVHGEISSLNHVARDTALRLQEEGRLPLGPCLPYPHEGEGAPATDELAGRVEDDIEFVEGRPLT